MLRGDGMEQVGEGWGVKSFMQTWSCHGDSQVEKSSRPLAVQVWGSEERSVLEFQVGTCRVQPTSWMILPGEEDRKAKRALAQTLIACMVRGQ